MERRKFLRVATSVGATVMTGFFDWAASTTTSTSPCMVGLTDVTRIRAAARQLRASDYTHGSGHVLETALLHVDAAAALLDSSASPTLRPQLHSAVGELFHVVGFIAFDAHAWHDARYLYRRALDCVDHSEDWRLWAHVLTSLARLDIWLGDPAAGLTRAEQALTAPGLTATDRAQIHAVRARALAPTGDAEATWAAIGRADDAMTDRHLANERPEAALYDDGMHAGNVAHALCDLVIAGCRHRGILGETISRQAQGMSAPGAHNARTRAFTQSLAAMTVMAAGDPAHAVAIGEEALKANAPIQSARASHLLWEIHRLAAAHASRRDVAELRHRIGQAAA